MLKHELLPGSTIWVPAGAAMRRRRPLGLLVERFHPISDEHAEVWGVRLHKDGKVSPVSASGPMRPVTVVVEGCELRRPARAPLCQTLDCWQPADWAGDADGLHLPEPGPPGRPPTLRCEPHATMFRRPNRSIPWREMGHRAHRRRDTGQALVLACRCGWTVWTGQAGQADAEALATALAARHDGGGWTPPGDASVPARDAAAPGPAPAAAEPAQAAEPAFSAGDGGFVECTVSWEAHCGGRTPRQVAETAWDLLRDPAALPPVITVSDGVDRWEIDLSEEPGEGTDAREVAA